MCCTWLGIAYSYESLNLITFLKYHYYLIITQFFLLQKRLQQTKLTKSRLNVANPNLKISQKNIYKQYKMLNPYVNKYFSTLIAL